jgi:hypothetical protein
MALDSAPVPSYTAVMQFISTSSALFFGAVMALLISWPQAAVADESAGAASYLVFESVADGRCQILSNGGKLRVLRNQHAQTAIDFRLMRVFAGKPQGLSTGIAEPGATPFKLGCTRVDGRAQDWVIERARFKQEDA